MTLKVLQEMICIYNLKLKKQVTSSNQSIEITASRNRAMAVTGLAVSRRSSESSSFSLTLKKCQDVAFLDRSLYIPHQISVVVPDEPDFNLCNTSSRS